MQSQLKLMTSEEAGITLLWESGLATQSRAHWEEVVAGSRLRVDDAAWVKAMLEEDGSKGREKEVWALWRKVESSELSWIELGWAGHSEVSRFRRSVPGEYACDEKGTRRAARALSKRGGCKVAASKVRASNFGRRCESGRENERLSIA
jgi:hypothetical protein